METIGERIARLRTAKGWKGPELGRRMAQAIGRKKPFSGELIRLYEKNINAPGRDARRALAAVFERSEVYIAFGDAAASQKTAREPSAAYNVLSVAALEVARAFDQLTDIRHREHVRRQIEFLREAAVNNSDRRRAAQHDMEIKKGALRQGTGSKKTRKGVR